MAALSSHEQLVRLHDIILQERECAKALDMEAMMTATREKEALLKTLGTMGDLAPEERAFAETIQAENRRNAYLFWSTLNWIKETMEFFGKQTAPAAYTANGYVMHKNSGGRLLSGKV